MTTPSPWDGIAIPTTDFTVRQLSGSPDTPCFWGRDAAGACLFIVELQGDLAAQFRRDMVSVNGLNIDLRGSGVGQQRLVLTLGSQIDRDLFASFCLPLAAAVANTSDSATALAVALAHIRRWKAFLSGGRARLSPEDIRGLFAEISFLNELRSAQHNDRAAVEAWLGPERSHQDFIFGNTSVEVKSVSGAERSTVRISSEDQLESQNDHIFLRVYRLSELPDDPHARSLNQLIDEVHQSLSDAGAIESFDRKLGAHGYAPLPAYDEPRLVVSQTRTFRVEGEFPRLIRSALPAAVTRVSYEIRLEDLVPFGCPDDSVFGGT
jgi:hypothetical protein